MIEFGSVCSGIEAASVAWHPLGWRAAWLSEIEPFPCAVLAHHYPNTPNLGDMRELPTMIRAKLVKAPDVFTGGTPCQAFSVAGLRKSLEDDRGNLSLTFVEIANAIDDVRAEDGRDPCVIVWENVPGVLSTKDNAFGCFLGALAGSGCELQPPRGRWQNAGVVLGPRRAIAWRILDAQYFGLAQRRRRVFVVASAREGFDPGAVLLEFDGVRRDSAPRREAGEGTARGAGDCAAFGGESGAAGAGCWWDGGQVSQTLDAVLQKGQTMPDKNRFPAVLVPDIIGTLTSAGGNAVPGNTVQDAMAGQLIPTTAHTLRGEGFDASEDGTGRGTPLVPVAFAIQAGALRTNPLSGPDGLGVQADHAYTLEARAEVQAVAFDQHYQPSTTVQTLIAGGSGGRNEMNHPTVFAAMQVRRLTPTEAERLMGFPDGYTAIPWRKKPASECPDGARYKALGNSWAVPVVAWLGKRIDEALRRLRGPSTN